MHGTRRMSRALPLPRTHGARSRRDRSLAEVQALAWLLDNSIRVPFTGGRRFGLDAVIGLVPGFGDLVSGALGLIVVWRASRMGVPRIVVARMLATTAVDIAIGVIPIIGDAFDLWFKANSRNLALMRRHLEEPGTSTRQDWLVLGATVGAALLAVALVGWLIVSLFAAVIGLFG